MHPEVRRLTVHHLNPHGSPRVRPLSAAGMPHPHWDLVLRRLRPAARSAEGSGSGAAGGDRAASGRAVLRPPGAPGGTTMYVHACVRDAATGGDSVRRAPATTPEKPGRRGHGGPRSPPRSGGLVGAVGVDVVDR